MKFLILLFLVQANTLMAWGKIGHRITAEIASDLLSAKAQKELVKILDGQSIADVSNWMDEVRSDSNFDWLKKLHYINAPENKKLTSLNSKEDNILYAINQMQLIISKKQNYFLSQEGEKKDLTKSQALKILIHLVGDLHQPLHIGYASDKGGNEIRLHWFNENINLHSLWDEQLIEHNKYTAREYADYLKRKFNKSLETIEKVDINKWAQESRDFLPQVYDLQKQQSYWEYKYIFRSQEILENRLFWAGKHLAYILENL